MLVSDFTIPQLLDIALCFPEKGVVNFNVLHTVLLYIVKQMDLGHHTPLCNVENPSIAKQILAKRKLKAPTLRKSFSAEEKQESVLSRPMENIESTFSDMKTPVDEMLEFVESSEGLVAKRDENDSDHDETADEDDDEQIAETSKTEKSKKGRFLPAKKDVAAVMKSAKQKAKMMTEMWRATNINKRVEAVEVSIRNLSTFSDRLTERTNEISALATRTKAELQVLGPRVTNIANGISDFTEQFASKQEISILRTATEVIEETKVDEERVVKLIAEHQVAGDSEGMDRLKQSVEDADESIRYLLNQFGLKFVPTNQKVETTEEVQAKVTEEPTSSVFSINDRFDDIWREIEKLRSGDKPQVGTAAGVDLESVSRLEDLIKSQRIEIDSINATLKHIKFDSSRIEMWIEDMQLSIDKLKVSKADKLDVEKFLDTKADKKDLDMKVDKAAFENTVDDLGEAIETLVAKFKESKAQWGDFIEKTQKELGSKLSKDDFISLQASMKNRVQALLYGYKKLDAIVRSVVYPNAAGITKCISCGRAAELAGSKCKPCGDAERDSQPGKGQNSVGNNHAHDDRTKECSEVGGNVMGNAQLKGRLFRKMKPFHKESKETAGNSTATRAISDPKINRFCGSIHTLENVKSKDSELLIGLPSKRSKEDINILGYNKILYKGVTQKEEIGKLPPDLNMDTIDFDEIAKSCYDPLEDVLSKKIHAPRFCGASHTLTLPLKKGIKFAPFDICEIPLQGQDEEFDVMRDSIKSNDVDQSHSKDAKGEMSKRVVQPNIITITSDMVSKTAIRKRNNVIVELPLREQAEAKMQQKERRW